MPFGRYTCGIQRHIVLDGGPWAPGEGWFWASNPQPKHAIANCSQTVSPMLPPGKYKRGAGWICRSDSAFCQITLVLVTGTVLQLSIVFMLADVAAASYFCGSVFHRFPADNLQCRRSGTSLAYWRRRARTGRCLFHTRHRLYADTTHQHQQPCTVSQSFTRK